MSEDEVAGCSEYAPMAAEHVQALKDDVATGGLDGRVTDEALEVWQTTAQEVLAGRAIWIKSDPSRLRRSETGELQVFAHDRWWELENLDRAIAWVLEMRHCTLEGILERLEGEAATGYEEVRSGAGPFLAYGVVMSQTQLALDRKGFRSLLSAKLQVVGDRFIARWEALNSRPRG
jgi:hypothetical protein